MGKIWPRAEPATRPGRKEAMRAPQTPDLPRSGPDPLPHKDTRMITRTLAAAIVAVLRSTGSLIHWLAIRATTARLPLHTPAPRPPPAPTGSATLSPRCGGASGP